MSRPGDRLRVCAARWCSADAMVRLMQSPDSVIGPINIGNPEEFTIFELASVVIDLTGSRSRIVHRPAAQDGHRS